VTAGCWVPGAGCWVRVLVLVLGAWCAVPGAAAQGRFTNARSETRSAAQGLTRELQAAAGRSGVTWVGYRVPMISGPRQMCCYDAAFAGDCCGMCRLENGSGVTMTTGDAQSRGSRIALEPPTELLVLARFENGAATRIRTFTPDCDVDAGGMTLVWLTDVKPDESVAWLDSLTGNKQAVQAIAMHNAASALNVLIRIARQDTDSRRRGDALFWLAQRAGQQAVSTITDAITNDPETDVKKKAVFALSQLPHDEGVPRLIEVARTHRNPEVRKQAFFWLGQTRDPRAIQFFEEILLKK
jgi:HEAT repeats